MEAKNYINDEKLIRLAIRFENARHGNKETFHKAGKSFFRALVKFYALPKGTYDIRSCLGGPAVMGEVVLHTVNRYVSISDNFSYHRTVKGLKDYYGDYNQQILNCVEILKINF